MVAGSGERVAGRHVLYGRPTLGSSRYPLSATTTPLQNNRNMVKLTVSVYRFFKGHKAAFWGILIVSTLFFGFFASRITFEEDISKLLPSAKEGGAGQ